MYKILIVEDDRTIARAVKKHIEAWGFNARCAEDFRNIMEEFADFNPQLVLLDISLPFFNGYHWCSEIRRVSKVPIVFISISPSALTPSIFIAKVSVNIRSTLPDCSASNTKVCVMVIPIAFPEVDQRPFSVSWAKDSKQTSTAIRTITTFFIISSINFEQDGYGAHSNALHIIGYWVCANI